MTKADGKEQIRKVALVTGAARGIGLAVAKRFLGEGYRVALLDIERLVHQLNSLERRRGRTGRDIIDHPKGGHDDLINAAAGALVLAQDGSSTSVPGFDRVIDYANNGSIA